MGGNVLLSTAGSTMPSVPNNNPGTFSATTVGFTVYSNLTGGNYISSVTYNGGAITAINGPGTTTVLGSFEVYANSGANVTNGGNIGGPVVAQDSVQNSWTTISYIDNIHASTANSTLSVTDTTVTGGNIVTRNAYTTRGTLTSSSDVTSSSTSSAGTTAVLVNSGTIGNSTMPKTNVLVNGDQNASGTNSGTIFGNVTVESFNFVGNASTAHAVSGFWNASHSSVEVTNYTGNTSGPFYLASSSSTGTYTSGFSSSTVGTNSYNSLGGNASLVNSGNITGDVTVMAADTASLVNTGTILVDPSVTANVMNSNFTFASSYVTNTTSNEVSTYTGANVSAGNFIQTFGFSGTSGWSSAFTGSFSGGCVTTGGVATLNNGANGNIASSVTVIGQAIGNVVNAGLIMGDANVQAFSFATTAGGNFNFGSFGNTETSRTVAINTGTNVAYNSPGFTILSATSFAISGGSSFSGNSFSTVTYTGGVAGLVNSGNITGDVTVEGVSSATLINTGQIDDPLVTANAFNTSFSDVFGSATSHNSVTTGNYTGAYDSTGNFIQTTLGSTLSVFSQTSFDTNTSTSTSTGGIAYLNNGANATIGNGNLSLFPSVIVTGQASANLTNAGIIYSSHVDVSALAYGWSTASAGTFGCMSSFSANSYSVTNTGNNTTQGAGGLLLSQGFSATSVSADATSHSYSYATAYSGGVASVVNTGVIDPPSGSLEVIGVASATLNNSGNITETYINVSADVTNSAGNHTSSLVSSLFSATASDSIITYVGNATVTSTTISGNFSHGSATSTASSANFVSAGGSASLVNSGNITGGGSFLTITVSADQTATLTNSGNILGFGNLTAGGVQIYVAARSGTSVDSYASQSSGNFTELSGGSSVYVNTGNATPNYFATSVTTDLLNWMHVTNTASSDSGALLGGVASLTNSGNIAGGVSLGGVALASLTNSGFIGESFGLVAVRASQDASSASSIFSNTVAGGESYNATFSGNFATNFVSASAGSFTNTTISSNSRTSFYASTGGNASLVNSGNIGFSASPHMTVQVVADGVSATAVNSGNIFGCITVFANAFVSSDATSHTFSFQSNDAYSGFLSQNVSGNIVTGSSTYSAAFGSSTSSATGCVSFTNVTGGIAALTNTGDITGNAGVFGNASASLINTINGNLTGVIGGNVTVNSVAVNTSNIENQTTFTSVQVTTSSNGASTTNSVTGQFSVTLTTARTVGCMTSSSTAFTSTAVSQPAMATLINDGQIGSKTNYVQVNVFADGSATATNTGTIYGCLSVAATAWSIVTVGTTNFVATSSDTVEHLQREHVRRQCGRRQCGYALCRLYADFQLAGDQDGIVDIGL